MDKNVFHGKIKVPSDKVTLDDWAGKNLGAKFLSLGYWI
jgi:hypothetical protein